MGFRFYRRFRVARGLRLNLSRSGVSATVGRRGSWLTHGPRGTRSTVGLPGAGLAYTEQRPGWLALLALAVVAVVRWLLRRR